VRDATDSPDVITRWFGQTYPFGNLAIATGATSGLLVIDVDRGGEETLVEFERQLGKLPDTVTCLTGGGGRHRSGR
jgi:putative DNA primase/helicase